jgi:hypothetical protein
MNGLHTKALQLYIRRWKWLFMFRSGIQGATVWFFLWGVVVLVARILGAQDALWLMGGLFGVAPTMFFAIWHANKKLPTFTQLRANFDQLNNYGGIMMSEEVANMNNWQARLPHALAPRLRWRSVRAISLLCLSALFAGTALLLPERLAHFAHHQPLEIGPIVEQLQAEVRTLAQEKIIEDNKAEDLQKQLSQLQKDASSFDPNKTWEALDHIKESNSDAAKQAAEEALAKTTALAQAETFAQALKQAAETGMTESTASQAAQDLASMLKSAKLEDGILHGQIPPELTADLKGLNTEEMQNLLKALEFNKNALGGTVRKLSDLKLIDPAMLAKCNKAGMCTNPAALVEYLSSCTNGCDSAALLECMSLGNGGPGGGGPAAPMTWSDGASEDNLKFQEHALPAASQLSDAQLVGVSQAAPEMSAENLAPAHGALDNGAAGGGAAHAQVILPEHRHAVQNFFKREK